MISSDPSHPFASVTVTEYVPVVLTYIDWDVSDVLHKYAEATGADRSNESPSHRVSSFPRSTAGSGFTVTTALPVPVQVFRSVTVTVYVSDWVTSIVCVEAKVDQEKEI